MFLFINYSLVFCISFGLMLLFSFIMSLLGLRFYTQDTVLKKFSIMDLQIPATAQELINLIRGLYKLQEVPSKRVVNALKAQLYVDFLFMPCAYGAIFLLCKIVASKMVLAFGFYTFTILAWAQLIAWLCDIIENIYLLRKIKKDPVISTPAVHKAYLYMVFTKWGIALLGTICAIASICYFWLTGKYAAFSLYYLLVILLEIILFLILSKVFMQETTDQ